MHAFYPGLFDVGLFNTPEYPTPILSPLAENALFLPRFIRHMRQKRCCTLPFTCFFYDFLQILILFVNLRSIKVQKKRIWGIFRVP